MGAKIKQRRRVRWDSVFAVVLIIFAVSGFYLASLQAEGKLKFSITGAFAADGNPAPEGSEGLPAPITILFGKSEIFSIMSASPVWGNDSWIKRKLINNTNIENVAKTANTIVYVLDDDAQINATSKSISYRDVRITLENGTNVPYQLIGYRTNITNDSVVWLSTTAALGSTAYYIYYNNSAVLDASTTIFSRYDFFENETIYLGGTYGAFDSVIAPIARNFTRVKNPTNITSNGSITITSTGSIRKSTSFAIVQPFIISWWQNPGVFADTEGLQDILGSGNMWGLAMNGSGHVQIRTNGNSFVATQLKADSADKWYQMIIQVNETSGENYYWRNETGLYFAGNESVVSNNLTTIMMGIIAGANAHASVDNFLIRQSNSLDFTDFVISNNITFGAEESVSACQTLSTAGSNYLQLNNITNSGTSQCIVIANQNITYDCGGFLIDGTDAGSSIGINVTASATNTTVKNCIITDWTEGIQDNSANSLFINIQGSSNSDGFFAGITPQASGTKILDSVFDSNVEGINDRGSNTNFTNITANSNSNDGINLNGKNNAFLNGITANSNAVHGIFSSSGGAHTVINSVMKSNARYGWFSSGAVGQTGFNNTYSGNTLGGFANSGGTITLFENMTFVGNTQWDINASTSATVNNFRNLDLIGNSNITLTSALGIALRNGTAPVADPANYTNISRWINVSTLDASPFMAINITYLASDIPAGWFEGNLTWTKFNGTDWITNASLFTNDFGVDTVNNIVWANVTGFSGKSIMFAPFISNVTVNTDTIAPEINFTVQTETNGANLSRNSIIVNVTATDADEVDAIVTRLYNSTSLYNTSASATSPFYLNFTGLADGTWYFNATANDTRNNINNSATRSVLIDTANPAINHVSPTEANNAYLNRRFVIINTTATDTNLKNITTYLFNITGKYNETNGAASPHYLNISVTADGNYTFNSTAYDTSSNANSTSTRRAIVDTLNPAINFTAPTEINGSALTKRNVVINITASDANLANITIYLFNATGLHNETTTTASPSYTSISVSADGAYQFNATAVDLSGNKNSTGPRSVAIDTSVPVAPVTTALAGSGAGGGGGGNIIARSNSISVNLEAGGLPKQVTGFTSTPVREISIAVNQKTESVLVSAGQLSLPPKNELGNKAVYKYLEISASGLDASRILSAEIKFKVENSWIEQNSNAETIALYRYSDGWQALPTRIESPDAEITYYSAKTPGFSLFAIAGDKPAQKKEEVSEIENKTITILKPIPVAIIPKQTNFNFSINPNILLGVLLAVLLLIGISRIDFKKIKQDLAERAKEKKRLKEYRLAQKRKQLKFKEVEYFAKNVRDVGKSFSELENLFKSKQFSMAVLFVLVAGGFIALVQNPASQNLVTGAVSSVSEVNAPAIDISLINPIYILIILLATTLISGIGYYVGSAVKQKHRTAKQQMIRRPAVRALVAPNYEWMQRTAKSVQRDKLIVQKKPQQMFLPRPTQIKPKPQMILETEVKKEVLKPAPQPAVVISEKPAYSPRPEKKPKRYRVAEDDVRLARKIRKNLEALDTLLKQQ